jgi:hypothetical protein
MPALLLLVALPASRRPPRGDAPPLNEVVSSLVAIVLPMVPNSLIVFVMGVAIVVSSRVVPSRPILPSSAQDMVVVLAVKSLVAGPREPSPTVPSVADMAVVSDVLILVVRRALVKGSIIVLVMVDTILVSSLLVHYRLFILRLIVVNTILIRRRLPAVKFLLSITASSVLTTFLLFLALILLSLRSLAPILFSLLSRLSSSQFSSSQ